jgi:SAM-dependent methyltransferase
MSVIENLLASAACRKKIWQLWYPFLTRRIQRDDVLFLNYAFEEDLLCPLPLEPADEPNRACIQLYHHVATQTELSGKDVLEVSCGHGGGASWITRTLHPAHYTGLDLNSKGIKFCRKRHDIDGLTFRQGDAEQLPFQEASFDAVINVEASHCYPSLPCFLVEVARVLRPGGNFLYTDFRFTSEIADWERELDDSPLRFLRMREINAEVLRGMESNSSHSLELLARNLPIIPKTLGQDFAGIPGSRVYRALQTGEATYRTYHFTKPAAATAGS